MRTVRISATVTIVTDIPDKYDELDLYDPNMDGDEPIFDELLADATEAVRRALPCVSDPDIYSVTSLDNKIVLLEY